MDTAGPSCSKCSGGWLPCWQLGTLLGPLACSVVGARPLLAAGGTTGSSCSVYWQHAPFWQPGHCRVLLLMLWCPCATCGQLRTLQGPLAHSVVVVYPCWQLGTLPGPLAGSVVAACHLQADGDYAGPCCSRCDSWGPLLATSRTT